MNRQICGVCGTEIVNDNNQTMTFCTNCGASLINQFYNSPNTQNTQIYPKKSNKPWLSGKEKFGIGALILIPIALILGGIAVVGIYIYVIANNLPSSRDNRRSYPTPYSPPDKTKYAVLNFGSEGLGEGQFKNASAIAVGKDGSIYVGDGTLRIQKFDASGKFVKLWNVTESKTKTDDKYSNRITDLAIDSKNIVYAAIERGELLRYDGNTGKFIDKVELFGDKWMNKPQEARVLDMFMQNDDKLAIFASSFPEGEYVIVVSPEGKAEIKQRDLLKKQDQRFRSMMGGGILVSVAGDIFLLNGYVGTDKPYIYRYKADGSYVDRFTWEGSQRFATFSGKIIGLNSKGEIYAYNETKKQINVLSVEGVLQKSIPIDATFITEMAVDSSDNIFIVNSNKVEKYSPAGN